MFGYQRYGGRFQCKFLTMKQYAPWYWTLPIPQQHQNRPGVNSGKTGIYRDQ